MLDLKWVEVGHILRPLLIMIGLVANKRKENEKIMSTTNTVETVDFNAQLCIKNFLSLHCTSEWLAQCDGIVLFSQNKALGDTFMRFLGTFIPEVKNVAYKVYNSRTEGHVNPTDLLNYGKKVFMFFDKDYNSLLSRTYCWIDLNGFELCEEQKFDDISFWKKFGDIFRKRDLNFND